MGVGLEVGGSHLAWVSEVAGTSFSRDSSSGIRRRNREPGNSFGVWNSEGSFWSCLQALLKGNELKQSGREEGTPARSWRMAPVRLHFQITHSSPPPPPPPLPLLHREPASPHSWLIFLTTFLSLTWTSQSTGTGPGFLSRLPSKLRSSGKQVPA